MRFCRWFEQLIDRPFLIQLRSLSDNQFPTWPTICRIKNFVQVNILREANATDSDTDIARGGSFEQYNMGRQVGTDHRGANPTGKRLVTHPNGPGTGLGKGVAIIVTGFFSLMVLADKLKISVLVHFSKLKMA